MTFASRFAQCAWQARWWLLAMILVGMLVGAARGQDQTKRWAHVFEDRDRVVFLELTPLPNTESSLMVVWGVDRTPLQCQALPSLVVRKGGVIRRERAANWSLEADGGMLDVTFPDTTLTYQRTRQDPRSICLPTQDT